MPDNPTPTPAPTPIPTFYRKARLEDFLNEEDNTSTQNNKYKNHYSQNDNTVSKNQQEFGHKKRIKP